MSYRYVDIVVKKISIWISANIAIHIYQMLITQLIAICLASVTCLHQTFASFSHASFAFRCKPEVIWPSHIQSNFDFAYQNYILHHIDKLRTYIHMYQYIA